MAAVTPRKKKHDSGVSLPEDIVFEVLARVPAKALCRLRSVCKGWRALISDPAFVAAQRSHAADPHLVGLFYGARYLPEVRVMDMDSNVVKAFEITRSTPLPPHLAARPDLICADGSGTRYGGIIIDPATGETFAAFDTSYADFSSMSYFTIFGRAALSGIFKVLRLEEPYLSDDDDGGGGGQQLCEVATIMDGSGGGAAEPLTWRRKSAPPFVITGLICEHRAIVNGVVYFVHELEIDGDINEDDYAALNLNCIVAFDLEREEWKVEVINGPALEHDEEGWSIALVELNGSLAFVHEVLVNGDPYTSIWLLVDLDKSVWVKEYMIPMPKYHTAPARPLGALVDGRILLWSSVREKEKTSQNNTSFGRCREVVLFYDPSTKAFTNFVELADWFRYTLVFYTGSLLS